MTTSQAIALLDELTYDEIREQLELADMSLSVSELDNQQVYQLAIDCLTDH